MSPRTAHPPAARIPLPPHPATMPTTPPTYYLPTLIGLTGLAGSGKDTVADHLVSRHGYQRISFAAPLRAMVDALLRHLDSAHTVEGPWAREDKERPIPELAQVGPITPRMLLQTLGTEWGRAVHTDLWLACATRAMQQAAQRGGDRFVVTDVRFPNEWAWISHQDGVIWQLVRPGVQPVRQHISESAVADLLPDAVLFNAGGLAQLHQAVDELLLDPTRSAA